MVSNLASFDLEKDCGKLITLVGIKMKGADGKMTFAPDDGSAALIGGCVNRDIEGMSNVLVRTSTYAKFAAMIMPTEKINITGIASRYNDTWQIMIRSINDITLTTADEVVEVLVMDMNGRKMATFDNTSTFDVSTLSSGVYIVRVKTRHDNTETITYLKLVKR
jgi:DNA/RNA endonuclease YhcR with UshA esterase domain